MFSSIPEIVLKRCPVTIQASGSYGNGGRVISASLVNPDGVTAAWREMKHKACLKPHHESGYCGYTNRIFIASE
jgi:hypothetical protein